MKCPRCLAAVEPSDRVCPTCHSFLIVESRPTRPDEETGWPIRRFGSIAGRAGSILFAARYAVVLVGLAALAGPIQTFFTDPTHPSDLSAAAPLIVIAAALDLVGAGLLFVAMVALGAGSVLMYRKDPFTDEESRVPPAAGTLAKAAGLFAFAWLLLTLAWRHALPAQTAWVALFPSPGGPRALPVGASAPDLLAAYASTGLVTPASAFQSMMFLWLLASSALALSAILLRSFARALPGKVVAPHPIEASAWFDLAVFDAILTIAIVGFPLGWLPFQGLEVLFRGLLATKLVVISLFGIPTYLSLQARFAAMGNLALTVPAMRAVPGGEPANLEEALAEQYRPQTRVAADGSGIDRVSLRKPMDERPEER